MWSKTSILFAVTLVSLTCHTQGQGYGASDDDDFQQQPQKGHKFPQTQQISSLPQYESLESTQQQQPAASNQQNNQNNLWWMGQNAFQRPAGHPGVVLSEPKNPSAGQAPQQNNPNNRNPNSYDSPPNNYNAFGGGQQKQTPNQYNKPAPQQYEVPTPQPAQPPQQYNNPAPPQIAPPSQSYNPPPQQSQNYNNPAPNQYEIPTPEPAQPPQFNQQAAQPAKPSQSYNPPSQTSQNYNNPAPDQYEIPTPQPAQPPQSYKPASQPSQQYNKPVPQIDLPSQSYNPPPQTPQNYNPAPEQYEVPTPQPAKPPQSYSPPSQQYNNPSAQQNQPEQPGFGWNGPQSQGPQQNYNSAPVGAPGCELRNKADCHKANQQRPNANTNNYQGNPSYNAPKPVQNYQPPPPQSAQSPPNNNNPGRPNNYQSPYNQNQYKQPQQQYQQPQQPYKQPAPIRPAPARPQLQQQIQNSGQGIRPNQPQQQAEPFVPYPGCPAAMLCVQDDYCNKIGLIEDNPIQLSAADKLHRVALMECSEPMTGTVGVCCRDPNYTDPWPDMQGQGMMKKDGNHHHHDKGQPNQGFGQALGNGLSQQKSPYFQQPPQSNHLASGGSSNPYSGPGDSTKNNGWTRNPQCANSGQNNSRVSKNIASAPSKNTAFTSLSLESKQTLHILEPCTSDELCVSVQLCNNINPQFMAKTGINLEKNKNSTTAPSLLKIKRCKYERSGIQYLCCKRPESTPVASTTSHPIYTSSGTHEHHFVKITPRPTTKLASAFTSPSTRRVTPTTSQTAKVPTTSQPTLIAGVGLRFHSNLHTPQQLQRNAVKPNPYGENEAPITLINSTPSQPFPTFGPTAPHTFRFTTTPPSTFPTTRSQLPFNFQTNLVASATSQNSQTAPAFSRQISTISTTPAFKSTTLTPITSITIKNKHATSTIATPAIITSTTPSSTTTNKSNETQTREKIDISRIPVSVPLRTEFKKEPPIGFIFKGKDLYIPSVDIPSQNYLVPNVDFEERILPTEPPQEDEEGENKTLTETTTVSIASEVVDNKTGQ